VEWLLANGADLSSVPTSISSVFFPSRVFLGASQEAGDLPNVNLLRLEPQEVVEKLSAVSFRGAKGDEESAFSLEIRQMQILRPDESGLGMTTKTSFSPSFQGSRRARSFLQPGEPAERRGVTRSRCGGARPPW
jgi:hypothetical protein